jgi:hypothetical protein
MSRPMNPDRLQASCALCSPVSLEGLKLDLAGDGGDLARAIPDELSEAGQALPP